ncbi:PAS domain S-box-containing protein [Andreprevotia lacus DSM 23236]|jgi:PAS domain S-box-containing protein|uniref:histidine kinase n=1 Tax=Andreprevotia lacus DSM 23236 TaxID=1121001 RepID=A0A1W1XW98_9NEIS|nr:PAS domain S-box protein [Andreprevotia lacus]SMC28206.1 PAS domain S-box-containing protein [Andreprevotia lacus DSM 23236]
MIRKPSSPPLALAHAGAGQTLKPLRFGLYLFYSVLVLLGLLMLVWLTVRDYDNAIADAERQNLSLARSLDEHTTRTLISVEQAMQNIIEMLEAAGGIDNADEYKTHILMKNRISLTPQVRGIIAIDSQGKLQSHGLEFPTRRVELGDRAYFKYHRSTQDNRPLIDLPVISRTDGQWLIPITRRINKPDGNFGGVVLAGVEPNYFLKFYSALKLDPTTRIQVLRSDGVVLLNYPFEAAYIGQNLRDRDSLSFEQRRLKHASSYIEQDPITGQRRIYAFHASEGELPIVIITSVDERAVLSKFSDALVTRAIIAVALWLIVSVLLYLLLRQIKRVEQIESRLHLTQFTVDEAPDLILWADRQGTLRYANRSASGQTHYEPGELLRLRFGELYPQFDERRWESLWEQLRQHRQLTDSAFQRDRHGRQQPVEITFNLIEFEQDAYLCATVRDVSERQNAERELRRHRDHLQDLVLERTAEIRTVLDASPLAIMLVVKQSIRLVNPAFETLFGHQSTDVIGEAANQIFASPNRGDETLEAIWARIDTGGVYRGELELYRRDHSGFWAMIYAKALVPGDRGKGMICVIEEVTAQRIAAQALRQSERLKRTIIDTTADGFLLIDAAQHIVDVNQSFCRMLGYRREDLIGQRPEALWHDTARQLFPAELYESGGAPNHVGEITLTSAQNEALPFLVSSAAINDENHRLEYAFAFLTNISRQKEIERNLVDAKEVAESANLAKSAFLANMSHELRTPMHAILSFSEMGLAKLGKGESGPALGRYLDRIHSSGNRLLVLLNDLLDMSRLEANKMAYNKSRQGLQLVAQQAATEIGSLLASKQLRLRTDDSTPTLYGLFDKARITQVVVNLLSNAIKFSPENGLIEIEFVSLGQLPDGRTAIGLTVRDHGPGVPEDELDVIFDKFIQSTRVRTAGGTGLGLAISRQIMEDHGGSIEAANHPEGGAIFTILLPADRVPG